MPATLQDSGASRNSILARGHAAMQRMETVGQRVRTRRLALGLEVRELAKAAGIKPSALSELESGRTKTSKSLHRIATALGVPVEWLAGDDAKPPVRRVYGPLDVGLLIDCIAELESQLMGMSLTPQQKAETIASCYEAESKQARAAILRLVRRVA